MDSNTSLLNQCFEQIANKNVDITEAVYKKYISNMPDVAEHIAALDERMMGRMLDQVYRLLLEDVDDDYLAFEVSTHQSYGATPERYMGLLIAVKDSVKEVLSERWANAEERAWDKSIKRVVSEIGRVNLVAHGSMSEYEF